MQRVVVTALLVSVSGTLPALAQPVPANPYYSSPPQHPQVIAAQPYYVAAPVAVQPEPQRPNLGGGFIEFLFSGGQTRYGRPVYQQQPVPQPVPVQPNYAPYVPAAAPPQRPMMQVQPPRPMLDPRYLKQTVAYKGDEKPGTIIVNTPERLLYLVEENGKALRYGIGVGRPGFTWSGIHEVTAKREWPDWRPPEEMLKRRPELPRYMPGGPDNPLGARALYLGSTLYRIHGSNEPWTIGQQVSSGCIRLRNEDVIDLYDRVKLGAKVVVI